MDLTFDGTIELNTVLTPGSYQLDSESRIISPLFTIKAPIMKTEDKVNECVFVYVCEREREREREKERGGEGRRRERKAILYCWCCHSMRHELFWRGIRHVGQASGQFSFRPCRVSFLYSSRIRCVGLKLRRGAGTKMDLGT